MTAPNPGAGRRLGRYHLGESLGGGPNGDVYQGKVFGVAGFERLFAVKQFHSDLVRSPAMAAKVASATRAYGSLEHPHIARLHEFGVAGGETFTATEFIAGIDLERMLLRHGGKLPAGAACSLVQVAATAVGYAHGRGHAHLGLCPTNILITTDGALKVSDFGILPPRLGQRPTQDDSLAHRMPFIAPEQLAGEPTSAATDVYQLGVILHLVLTGRAPFDAANAFELAQQILSGAPPDPHLPKPLVKVLRRCLARSPFERYPDARTLGESVQKAITEEGIVGDVRELGATAQAEYQALQDTPPEQRALPVSAPPKSATGPTGAAAPGRVVRGPKPADLKRTMMAVAPPPPKAVKPDGQAPAANDFELGRPGGTGVTGDSVAVELPPPGQGPDMSFGPAGVGHDDATTIGSSSSQGQDASLQNSLGKPQLITEGNTTEELEVGQVEEVEEIEDELGTETRTRRMDTEDVDTRLFEDGKPVPPRTYPRAQTPPPPLPRQHFARHSLEDLATLPNGTTEKLASPGSATSGAASTGGLGPPITGAPIPGSKFSDVTAPPTDSPSEIEPPALQAETQEPVAAQLPAGAAAPSLQPGPTPPESSHDLPVPQPAPLPGGKSSSPIVLILIALLVVGGGAFAAFTMLGGDGGDETASGQADPGDPDRAGADTPATEGGKDEPTAKPVAAIDAAPPEAVVDAPPPTPEKLVISSEPKGAKVYVDGSLAGKTPLEFDSSGDKHRVALIRAGFELHTTDVENNQPVEVTLKEVTPPGGPAGIKVRCKKKNRYYVFVDGHAIGQLCPTERIGVDLGDHVVEIYDPITDARREFNVKLKQTRRSLRVRVD